MTLLLLGHMNLLLLILGGLVALLLEGLFSPVRDIVLAWRLPLEETARIDANRAAIAVEPE